MNITLEKILATPYAYVVSRDPDDGTWNIVYPDLPGCMSHADDPADIDTMARAAFELWVTTRFEDGAPIPPATFDVEAVWDQNWDAARYPAITTDEAASELGITPSRVRQMVRAQGLGRRHGRAVVLTERDMDILRQRPAPGRPRATTV